MRCSQLDATNSWTQDVDWHKGWKQAEMQKKRGVYILTHVIWTSVDISVDKIPQMVLQLLNVWTSQVQWITWAQPVFIFEPLCPSGDEKPSHAAFLSWSYIMTWVKSFTNERSYWTSHVIIAFNQGCRHIWNAHNLFSEVRELIIQASISSVRAITVSSNGLWLVFWLQNESRWN